MTQQGPRSFLLVRPTAAGVQVAAEGVEWSDRQVTLRWCEQGLSSAVSVWEGGLEAVLAAHGDDGATRVQWFTGPQPEVAGTWLPAASLDGRCVRCGRIWPCLGCGP